MTSREFSAVILAAGLGKRMKLLSSKTLPKALLPIAGLPMLGHVLVNLRAANAKQMILVLAPGMDEVASFAKSLLPDIEPEIEIVIQNKALGTGDGVKKALSRVKKDRILVAYSDTPLVSKRSYKQLASASSAVTLASFKGDERGYGRVVCNKEIPLEIIEDDQRIAPQDFWLNGGVMALDKEAATRLLVQLKNDNVKREYYLTDIVKLACAQGLSRSLYACAREEVLGANTLAELASLEAIYQNQQRDMMLGKGVCLTAPETVFFAWDTQIGTGTMIEPYVFFGTGVKIGKGVRVKSFSHIEGAVIKSHAVIGPYARLRHDTEIGEGSYIGNFVEIKKTKLGANSKANHLTYLGDAKIGKGVNVGAGTITCNYDGRDKHLTQIGDGVFIGSNTALVAPVRIGDKAYIGSGSVITDDVAKGSLALGRARQVVKKRRVK